MDKQEWKQFVLRFLKENNALSEYMKRSREHFINKHKRNVALEVNENNIIESLFDFLRKKSMEDRLIDVSFSWESSLGDPYFWFKLSNKFKTEYSKRIEQEEEKEKKEREKYKNHNNEEELTNKIYERMLKNNIFGYGTIINNENSALKCIMEWRSLM